MDLSSNNCVVCMKNDPLAKNVTESSSSNEKWFCMLKFTIPEIAWSDSSLLCLQCMEEVQNVFKFKKSCMERYGLQGEITTDCDCSICYTPMVKVEEELKIDNGYKPELIEVKNEEINGDKKDIVDDGGIIKKKKLVKRKKKKRTDTIKKYVLTCKECDFTSLTPKKLLDHMVEEHDYDSQQGFKPFECDLCDKKFTTAQNLTQHIMYHKGERVNMCPYCGKGFITRTDLSVHEKQHLNRKDYLCTVCSKGFNTHKDLRSHRVAVHTDSNEWKYICGICEKRFPIKSNLDNHTRRHLGDKRFECHLCDKKFIERSALRKHILSHSNVRNFRCESCGKEYKHDKNLQVHMKKEHGLGEAKLPPKSKRHYCHICPKSYFAKNKLTRHLLSHTGEKPYPCPICDKRFTDKCYVKNHMKNNHNNEK